MPLWIHILIKKEPPWIHIHTEKYLGITHLYFQVYSMLEGKRDVETVLTMGIMEDVSIIPQPAGNVFILKMDFK